MTPRTVKPPAVVDSGRVVSVSPPVLSVKDAAIYCACSTSSLNTWRAADAKRLQRGEQLVGPAWVMLSYGIRYPRAYLDAWIQRTSVPCGVMESRRRATPAAGRDVEAGP